MSLPRGSGPRCLCRGWCLQRRGVRPRHSGPRSIASSPKTQRDTRWTRETSIFYDAKSALDFGLLWRTDMAVRFSMWNVMICHLVGGLEYLSFFHIFHILGTSSSQLTFIFSEGLKPPTSNVFLPLTKQVPFLPHPPPQSPAGAHPFITSLRTGPEFIGAVGRQDHIEGMLRE